MKKLILMIAACALLAGCAGNSGAGAGNPADQEISVSIFDRKLIPREEGTYQDNRWTRWVSENSGVNVRWVPVPRHNERQALDIMFASHSAPDLIVSDDREYLVELAGKGQIQPVGQYIDEFSTAYREEAAQHDEFRIYTTINKQTYLFTSVAETTATSAIWIRKDWLDELGLPVPMTDQQLLDCARAFRQADPDGNGLDDTLGLVFTNNLLEQTYMVDQQWYADEAGRIYNAALSDRYLAMLDFKKQLFDEGLIDREYVTDINSQRQLQTWINGKAGILFSGWEADDFRQLFKKAPNAKVIALEPLDTQFGRNGYHQKAPTGNYVAFNSQMKSPKAGVEFLDWMLDSGYQTLLHGIEGVHHTKEYGFVRPIDVEKNNRELRYATMDMPVLRKGTISPARILELAPLDDPFEQNIAQLNASALEISKANKARQDIPAGIYVDIRSVQQFDDEWQSEISEIENKYVMSGLSDTVYTRDMLAAELKLEWDRLGGTLVQAAMQYWYDENKDSFYYGQ